MSRAAAGFAESLRASGARRIAFLGLAKNAGKSTALTAVLAEMHRAGTIAGATSAGRDGEEFDAITGEPKPRFRVYPGQLVASAATTFESASFPVAELATLPFPTRFGPVQLRRAEGEGEIEVIGPSTASQVARTAAALEAAGAEIVLLDGAVGRRAFAAGRVSDGIVLSVGMSAGETLPAVLSAAVSAVELIRLRRPEEEATRRHLAGAVTAAALRGTAFSPGEALVAEDFTAIFLSPADRRELAERGVRLAVRRPARLLAVTTNPTAPARPPLPAERFFEAVAREISGVPIFDLCADLRSDLGADLRS
jgi:hypothetical protein